MLERRRGEMRAKTYEHLALGLAAVVCMLVLALSLGLSLGTSDYNQTEAILWEEAKADSGTPMEDYDFDGIANIDENYVYGTNIYRPDTDDDGMDDYWEVQWFDVRDTLTEELVAEMVTVAVLPDLVRVVTDSSTSEPSVKAARL